MQKIFGHPKVLNQFFLIRNLSLKFLTFLHSFEVQNYGLFNGIIRFVVCVIQLEKVILQKSISCDQL
jgi:hypothetical protein